MLSRKRKLPIDDYIESLLIPIEKRQKMDQFYENLRVFYRRKWNFPLKPPYVNGMELNLYDLYETVVNLGGWQKVTSFDRWNEVLQKLSIDENIQMAEHIIHSLYMQYLSKFEQNESGNDIVDEHENELLSGRSNRLKGIGTMTCYYEPPFSAPRTVTATANVTDFHKVIFSFLSGLPNEVAFGLNILTIMSHPGPLLLNFTHCPHLINILVAIVGITLNFEDFDSLSKLHDWWEESTEYKMTEFWIDAGVEDEELFSYIYNPGKNIDLKQLDLFQSTSDGKLDINKPINWRVFNILGIFHNVSFEEMNHQPMARSKAFLRFMLLCCDCRYQLLRKSAYETLSNIAGNIDLTSLDEALSKKLLKTIQTGLYSNDKFNVLRSMEILAGLSHVPTNESVMCDFLDESQAIARIFTLMSLKEILICVVSLESLLQITDLGKTSCDLVGSCKTSIDCNVLVGMLTTDAASFGQIGLYGMKVVEIRGHHMQPYTNPNKKNMTPQHNNPLPPQLQTTVLPGISTDGHHSLTSRTPQPTPIPQFISPHNYITEYMCEWMMLTVLDEGEEIEPCSRLFESAPQLLYHIYRDHLKTLVQTDISPSKPDDIYMIKCRWPMCDNTPRTLWSMTTHLQDVHCTENNLEMNARRRCELGFDEYINQIRQHYEKNLERDKQPGYSPFAAYEAIRRHAFVNVKKEITDDSEGPVTRNLRLTAALILRNICRNSVAGRKKLRKYESFISWLSLSKMESSRTLTQCLAEIVGHSCIGEADQQTQAED